MSECTPYPPFYIHSLSDRFLLVSQEDYGVGIGNGVKRGKVSTLSYVSYAFLWVPRGGVSE
jgi:hypothetical protein